MAIRLRTVPVTLLMMLAVALVLAACADDEPEDDIAADDDPADVDPDDDEDVDDEDVDDEDVEASEGALEGELITFVVGTSPGGGFDAYTRLVAPFLGEELGADVTVENTTGAGGLLALNQVWVAEPDGTTIGMMNGSGVIGSVLGDSPGIEFELEEFSYLGRLAGEPRLFNIYGELPYEEAGELVGLEDEFNFSATGPGGGTYIDATLGIELFDMQNGGIIAGFDGSEEAVLAVTAGEADGIMTTMDSALPNIEAGDHKAMAVFAEERLDELPDTPSILEVEEFDDEQRSIAEAMVAIIEGGRVLVAPPDMPEDVHAEISQALDRVVEDPEFLEEAETQGRPISYLDRHETLDVFQTALDAPDVVRETLAEAAEE